MEPNISNARDTSGYKFIIRELCEVLGVRPNTFNDIKGNSNGKQVNISSDIYDVKNLYFRRKKRILSCLGVDDLNEKLPNELILLIFKWLPKQDLVHCTMVCKRWYKIAQTEILWSRLDLYRKTLHDSTLWHILSRGVKVLRLAQAKIITLTSQEIRQHINDNDICKIQYLDASMAMISPDNLAILLSKCRNLQKLSLESCTLNEAYCEIISHCTALSVLNLAMCKGMNCKCISNLLKLQSLTELNVAWCSLDNTSVCLLCRLLPRSLARLNMSGCTKSILDDDITNLVESCPDLIELDLSDCSLLTSVSLCSILELSKLKHLSLNRCYSIDLSTYIKLTRMPRLIYLDTFGLPMPVEPVLKVLQINKFMFSSIARPTAENNRKAIWGLRVKN